MAGMALRHIFSCLSRSGQNPGTIFSRAVKRSCSVRNGSSSTGVKVSPFPVLPLPPLPSLATNQETAAAAEENLQLFSSVVEQRKRVWSTDSKISSEDREGRKLTVGERLRLLVDPGSEILEIGTLAGLNMPYGDVCHGNNIVCVVRVCGEVCVVSANDWTFKGGTAYPISVKKQLRAQEIALANRLPCIYLVDSGGGFLPLQAELYPDKDHGGRVFRNQAILSSLEIPQVAVVTGMCTAGGAYIPTMSDEAVIVQDIGFLYLGGPPLVRAATGEVLTAEELGGATVHCGISGCTDYHTNSEEEAMQVTRSIVASLNLTPAESGRGPAESGRGPAVEEPLYSDTSEEFSRILPTSLKEKWPVHHILCRLLDGSRLHQFKAKFGPSLITGFARVKGHLVGVLANDGELSADAATKGAHFARLCTLRGIPMLFFVNTPPDSAYLSPTGNDGKTAKARAQMMAAIATSSTPKITIVLGGCYGPSALAMCSRAMQPNFLFCWPTARTAMATPHQLLTAIIEQGGYHGDREDLLKQLSFEERVHPSSNLVNDGVILPSETRQILSQCLDICSFYPQPADSQPPRTTLNVLRM